VTTFLASFIATIVTLPIVGYLAIFIAVKQLTKNHRKAVNYALNGSTIFFILSVHFIIKTIWEISLFWFILLVIIMISMLVVFVHYKLRQEIDFSKVTRGTIRLNAVVFIIAYGCLITYGIFRNLFITFF